MSLDDLRETIKQINTDHGFRDESVFNDPTLCKFAVCSLLIVSEITEMFEAVRGNPNDRSTKIPDFTAIEEEHADIMIRCIDLADQFRLRFEDAIKAKLQYNQGRKYKHGKRF